MSTPIDTRAQQIRADLRACLVDAAVTDADKVVITSDARDIDKAATQRHGIIIVRPYPLVEWPAQNVTRRTWSIDVLQKADSIKALPRIDSLVEAIRRRMPVSAADPEDSDRIDGGINPGYTLILTEDHLD